MLAQWQGQKNNGIKLLEVMAGHVERLKLQEG